MILRAYIAAPYIDAPAVRDLGARLLDRGVLSTARWAIAADGAEDLARLSLADVRRLAWDNDRDVLRAHVLLALARDGAGAEMFAEVRLALDQGIPVIWIGTRRPLSAYREGVRRVDSLDEGLRVLDVLLAEARKPWLSGDDNLRAELWTAVEELPVAS